MARAKQTTRRKKTTVTIKKKKKVTCPKCRHSFSV